MGSFGCQAGRLVLLQGNLGKDLGTNDRAEVFAHNIPAVPFHDLQILELSGDVCPKRRGIGLMMVLKPRFCILFPVRLFRIRRLSHLTLLP